MLIYKVEQFYFEDYVYFIGDIMEWQLKDEYQFCYNLVILVYVGCFFLKQGYYNYYIVIVLLDVDLRKLCVLFFDKIEGNYVDIENDYYILLYYCFFGIWYDQIVGYV